MSAVQEHCKIKYDNVREILGITQVFCSLPKGKKMNASPRVGLTGVDLSSEINI